MNSTSFCLPIFLAVNLLFQGWLSPGLAKPSPADWCQCVIFVMNLLGIKQIPGEYWTAASLAKADQYGKTWMDYQGYTQRPRGELPQTGDLLILDGGAEVITLQVWDGSEHLVPVPVDAWAGHMGIVLDADTVEKEESTYTRIHLLSANWGVSAHNLGVVGSCFNVDESTFLLPLDYQKAYFFYPADPVKMRERMVNRANRWSTLGLSPAPQGSLDGFPVTPSGFISNILEPVGEKPITPVVTDIRKALVEIQPMGVLPGDILVMGEETNPGLGVITTVRSNNAEDTEFSFDLISMQPGGKATGPENWQVLKKDGDWSAVNSEQKTLAVRFFRYRQIPDYPALQGNLQLTAISGGNEYQVGLSLTSGGSGAVALHNLELVAYPVLADGKVDTANAIRISIADALNLKPGELEVRSVAIHFPENGDYLLGFQSADAVASTWSNHFERITVKSE